MKHELVFKVSMCVYYEEIILCGCGELEVKVLDGRS